MKLATSVEHRHANIDTASDSLSGPELLRATRRFAVEDRQRSWRLLLSTLALFVALQVGIVLVPAWWAKLALSMVLGLLTIRVFIFYHDHLHGAIFEDSRLARGIMSLVGVYLLSVRSVWQETHDYHHRNNAKLIGSGIGSFPVVSTTMWRRMNSGQRRSYKLLRHPAIIFSGYLTVFLIGMAIAPFRRNPRLHWAGPLSVIVHVAAVVALSFLFGPWTAVCLLVIPTALGTGLGAYLFYAQHNFPEVEFFDRREWGFDKAALRSSSMFDMPRWMHWFTGNIGYHHIHHLNHRIPFYRLPEVMETFPEFQNVGRTSWKLQDIRACLALDVWDPAQRRMISLDQPAGPAPAKPSHA